MGDDFEFIFAKVLQNDKRRTPSHNAKLQWNIRHLMETRTDVMSVLGEI